MYALLCTQGQLGITMENICNCNRINEANYGPALRLWWMDPEGMH